MASSSTATSGAATTSGAAAAPKTIGEVVHYLVNSGGLVYKESMVKGAPLLFTPQALLYGKVRGVNRREGLEGLSIPHA